MGSDQGSWLTRDVECCARSRACHSTPVLDELNGLMCGMRGGPILLEPLDGMSVRAPSLHYRHEPPENPAVSLPSYVWVRPCPSSDQKGPITPELLTAHHAVHFRLCRGLSLTMSGAVVVQNWLFWVLTLPSGSKLPLSKGYGPDCQVKFNNVHFFLCVIHTHDHD